MGLSPNKHFYPVDFEHADQSVAQKSWFGGGMLLIRMTQGSLQVLIGIGQLFNESLPYIQNMTKK